MINIIVFQSESVFTNPCTIHAIQASHENYAQEVQRLSEENESLRSHLRDVVHSPLSDSEKQKIIDDSQRLHNSAPASIAMPIVSVSCVGCSYDNNPECLCTPPHNLITIQ